MRKETVGVIVGRFQIPELHDGHHALIQHVKSHANTVCVLVGMSKSHDVVNPLPYPVIDQMIRTEYPDITQVHPVTDITGEPTADANDLLWSRRLDTFLGYLFPYADIKLYGGRDSFRNRYHGNHRPVIEFTGFDPTINATSLRQEIIDSPAYYTPQFAKGIIYGIALAQR